MVSSVRESIKRRREEGRAGHAGAGGNGRREAGDAEIERAAGGVSSSCFVGVCVYWSGSGDEMASWRGRSGLGWFCFGVFCFRVSLDQTGARVTRSDFALAGLLLWFQRHLHAGAGPAPAPPASFLVG